jgi:hypothetical protein
MGKTLLKPGDKFTDFEKLNLVVRDAFENRARLNIWQETDGHNKGGPFAFGEVLKFDSKTVNLSFFSKDMEVMVLGQQYKFVSTAKIKGLTPNSMSLTFPREFTVIGDDFFQGKKVFSIDQEERFLIKREEIRKRPAGDGKGIVEIISKNNKKNVYFDFYLFDLSANGLGIVVKSIIGWEFDDEVQFEFLSSGHTINAMVKSIRAMRNDRWRIGFQLKIDQKVLDEI